MKNLITAALMALATPAIACDVTPDGGAILIGSNHVGATVVFNEENTGLFLSWGCGPVDVRAGTYKNSFYNQSWAVNFSSDYTTLSAGGFNAGLIAGAAHYPENGRDQIVSIGGSDWIFMAGLEITHDDLPLFVQFYPGDSEKGDYQHLIAWGLQVDF